MNVQRFCAGVTLANITTSISDRKVLFMIVISFGVVFQKIIMDSGNLSKLIAYRNANINFRTVVDKANFRSCIQGQLDTNREDVFDPYITCCG